jgi:flagellar basal-body rod protein FlgC
MFDVLDIGASGLMAQRLRLETVAANIAGSNTILDENGRNVPFRRRFVVMQPGRPNNPDLPGVRASVRIDHSPFKRRYEPDNPVAGPDGYVLYPNIDPVVEQVNALEASRAYEANVTMMDVTKAMINASLRLIA